MKTDTKTSLRQPRKPAKSPDQPAQKIAKKDQILALYASGISDVQDLALITHSRPSYVAGVLQQSKLLPAYFDLYTSSAQPMNVYSKFFAKKLGYKDEATARDSVELIDHFYRQFELAQDRSGQHHALLMALTMFDRARWTGKEREAEVFRQWLASRLREAGEDQGQGLTPTNTDQTPSAD